MRLFYFSLFFIVIMISAVEVTTKQSTLGQQISSATTNATNVTNGTSSNYLTYNNPTFGIKILYPSDWKIGKQMLTTRLPEVNFYSPRENTSDFLKRADFDITVSNYTLNFGAQHTQTNLEDLVKKFIRSDKYEWADFNLTEFIPTAIAGNQAYKEVFTWKAYNGGHIKNMYIYTVKNNQLYIIRYLTSITKYPHYLPTIQNMIRSIEFVKPESENMFYHYLNSFYGIRTQFPNNWKISEHVTGDNFVPVISFASPQAIAIVTINVLDSKNMSIGEFAKYSINNLQQRIKPIQINTTNIDNDAYVFLGTLQLPRYGSLKVLEAGTITGDKVYLVRYYAEASIFANYFPALQKIANSLKFEPKQNPDNSYINSPFNLKIKFPSKWGLIYTNHTSEQSGTIAQLIIPSENASDSYSGLILVTVNVLSHSPDPSKDQLLNNIYLDRLRKTLKDFEIINSSDNATLGGNHAHMIEYAYTTENSTKMIYGMSVYTIKGNKVYNISFNTLPGKHDEYIRFLPIVRQIVSSFQIADPKIEPSP